MSADKVEVYTDKAGEFRWRYVASNGKILADSGEGYKRKKNALKMAYRVLGMAYSGEESRSLRGGFPYSSIRPKTLHINCTAEQIQSWGER